MPSVTNHLFGGNHSPSLPELSPNVRKTALIVCGIAGCVFVGVQAHRLVRSVIEWRIRDRVVDYIVVGMSNKSKLTSRELAIKAEAVAVRKRICIILQQISEQENPRLTEQQQKDLSNLIALFNGAFSVWDRFGFANQNEGSLPLWWFFCEKAIRDEILEIIHLRYSTDASATAKMRTGQNEHIDKLIDSVLERVQEKNETPLDAVKIAALTMALNALRRALKE